MSYETDGPYLPRESREQPDAIRDSLARSASARGSRISRPNLIAY